MSSDENNFLLVGELYQIAKYTEVVGPKGTKIFPLYETDTHEGKLIAFASLNDILLFVGIKSTWNVEEKINFDSLMFVWKTKLVQPYIDVSKDPKKYLKKLT